MSESNNTQKMIHNPYAKSSASSSTFTNNKNSSSQRSSCSNNSSNSIRTTITQNHNKQNDHDTNDKYSQPPYQSESTPSSPRKNDSNKKDLFNTLLDYCNHVSGQQYHTSTNNHNNNHHDMNTSFSISSHAMRQRKLLRNITFELKQLANLNNGNNCHNNDHQGMIEELSFFIKGLGYQNVIISNNNNDQQLIDCLFKVIDSVNGVLYEEYFERKDCMDTNNDNVCILATGVGGNGSNNCCDTNDSLIAALEFLNVAYTCLEPNIIFAMMQRCVDSDAYRCLDITKVDDEDKQKEENSDNDNFTVMDVLLYFTLDSNGNGVIDINYEEENDEYDQGTMVEDMNISFLPTTTSKESWEPSVIQILAFSILTKAMLNAEYIQRYCSSLHILPEDNIDTLLGNDMGIGLVSKHYDNITKIVQMAICYLSSIPSRINKKRRNNEFSTKILSLSPQYQSNDNERFIYACMSFLSCLFRTNASEWMLVPISNSITKKMIIFLQQLSLNSSSAYLERGSGNFGRAHSHQDFTISASSTLAQGLLLIIEFKSPGSTQSEYKEGIIGERFITRLIHEVFSSQTSTLKSSSYSYACSIYLLISLCVVCDERLKYVLRDENIISVVKQGICHFISNYEYQYQGQMMLLVHFISSYPRFRRPLSEMMEENDRNNSFVTNLGSFFHIIRRGGYEGSFSSLVCRLVLVRAIVSNISAGINDNLSSKLLFEMTKLPLIEFCNSILEPFVHSTSIRDEHQPLICCIVDFIQSMLSNSIQQRIKLNTTKSDQTIEALTAIVSIKKEEFSCKNALHFGIQLGAALALGQFILLNNQLSISITNCKMIPKLLKFATNTLSGDMNDSKQSSSSIIEYAVYQGHSRDLTRRAHHLDTILASLSQDVDCVSSVMFTLACQKLSFESQVLEQSSRYNEKLDLMTAKYEEVQRENDKLKNDLANKNAFYSKELLRVKVRSKADATEHAELLVEENIELKQNLISTEDKLNDALNSMEREKSESHQRENALKEKFDDSSNKVYMLEEQLKGSQKIINEKIEEVTKSHRVIESLQKDVEQVKCKLGEDNNEKLLLKNSYDQLVNNHSIVKGKLEEALSKLISLANAFVNLEQNSLKDRKEFENRVKLNEKKEYEIASKYQRLKEMYRDAEEKIKNLSMKYQKLKSSKSSSSQLSKLDTDMNSSRRRKPMGTLAFMNSIHDNSMRSDKRGVDDKDMTKKKKKNTSFRIMR